MHKRGPAIAAQTRPRHGRDLVQIGGHAVDDRDALSRRPVEVGVDKITQFGVVVCHSSVVRLPAHISRAADPRICNRPRA